MRAGICGILQFDGCPVAEGPFLRMKSMLSGASGPSDAIGDWYAVAQAGGNSTGHEGDCLSVDEQFVVCFEGRIDNRRSLIRELKLPDRCSYADIIRAGHSRWARALPAHLLGAFAFIIIDRERRGASIAIDHLGLRPLYYHRGDRRLTFGSDIRQVLEGGSLPVVVDRGKVLEFLSPIRVIDESWSDPTASFFSGVDILDYATSLTVDSGGRPEQEKYWSAPSKVSRLRRSADEWAHAFRDVFLDVVSDQLDMDGPIGADLSGGIDSGSLVFAAHDTLSRTGRADEIIHAYTLKYSFDASRRDVEKIRGILRDYPKIVWHVLEADGLCGPLECGGLGAFRQVARPCTMNIPESFVTRAQMASGDGCRVLLTGEGADWYLEGIDVIWDSAIRRGNWRLVAGAIKTIASRGSLPLVARYLFRYALLPLLPRSWSRRGYVREYYENTYLGILPDIFGEHFRGQLKALLASQRAALLGRDGLESWAQTLEHDLLFPPNHVWQGLPIDIEVRQPYLDRRLIEFGLAVPPECKFAVARDIRTHYGSRKVLQRRGLRDIVPPAILDCQEKASYEAPMNQRLRKHLPPLFSDGHARTVDLGIVDGEKMRTIARRIAAAHEFPEVHPLTSWLDAILSLELWLRATCDEWPSVRMSA